MRELSPVHSGAEKSDIREGDDHLRVEAKQVVMMQPKPSRFPRFFDSALGVDSAPSATNLPLFRIFRATAAAIPR